MGNVKPGSLLPDKIKDAQLLDGQENNVTLASLMHDKPTLLVFIRHFGCLGCSVHMAELAPRIVEMHELGLDVFIIGNGKPLHIEGFIERFKLDPNVVTVLTDPSLEVYKAAGLERSVWASLGPKGMLDMFRALANGHSQNSVEGDNWQQGGAVLLDNAGKVAFYHRNLSLSDHADTNVLIDTIYALLLNKNPLYAE